MVIVINDFGIVERSTAKRRTPAKLGQDPYVAFALRWWWLGLAGVLLGLAATALYFQYGPVPYSSMALVIVNSQSDVSVDSMGTPSKLRAGAETYAGQMASAPVYIEVAKNFPGPGTVNPSMLQDLVQQKKIVIAAQKSTNLIGVTVTDDDPTFSRALADTFAESFVTYVNEQAKTELAERRDELQRQIDHTNEELTAAQLQQRGEDLQKELQGHRTLLLQLQMQYQQEIERQITADRLQQLAAGQAGGPAGSDADVSSEETDASRAQVLAAIREQQANEESLVTTLDQQVAQARKDAEATISGLNAQLANTRAELAGVTAALASADGTAVVVGTGEDAETVPVQDQILTMQGRLAALQEARREAEAAGRQQQAKRSDLQSQEQRLTGQYEAQRSAAQDIDAKIQQEQQRQVVVRQQAMSGPVATSNMPREQRRAIEQQRVQARQAAEAQASMSDDTIDMLRQRKGEAERQASSYLNQVGQVRQQLAQLPPAGSTDAAVNQIQREATDLEQQLRVLQQRSSEARASGQTAQAQRTILTQREQDLQRQIADARTKLNERERELVTDAHTRQGRVLAFQTQYQNEVQRQAEADRRQAEADQREAAAAAGPAAVSTNPQLAQARAQLHTQWLDVISNQIRDVQGNIEETTKQLASVRDSQQKYNASANPAVASMFVGAYSNMLQNLTRDLVRLQLNESAASAPIYRYGEASEPVRRLSIRRAAAFGIGGGLAVALAIAYALHFFYDGRQLPFARGNVEETHRQLTGPVAPGAESTGRIAAPTRSLRERVAAARGRTLVTELPRESAVR